MTTDSERILVIIPTYNEADNLRASFLLFLSKMFGSKSSLLMTHLQTVLDRLPTRWLLKTRGSAYCTDWARKVWAAHTWQGLAMR